MHCYIVGGHESRGNTIQRGNYHMFKHSLLFEVFVLKIDQFLYLCTTVPRSLITPVKYRNKAVIRELKITTQLRNDVCLVSGLQSNALASLVHFVTQTTT